MMTTQRSVSFEASVDEFLNVFGRHDVTRYDDESGATVYEWTDIVSEGDTFVMAVSQVIVGLDSMTIEVFRPGAKMNNVEEFMWLRGVAPHDRVMTERMWRKEDMTMILDRFENGEVRVDVFA